LVALAWREAIDEGAGTAARVATVATEMYPPDLRLQWGALLLQRTLLVLAPLG
jgi:hypothetical protein